ncbi:HlyD family type I secretion periplasmic adaptor subunit [Mangrovicoccus algicola]|uniref:Membrane fusion protein (MFP) family protein n=1 Tax=Mangrovicoccus algicola TaxID=2771008 RepID=A0A8J7CZ46_9RHOB|nr:HlyD family type I secretion periplasmic adaptor subunit [Mangrovicoccus algicola]MBE3640392.1 HlyD family type I secretion periplasmic adaptor subunit [Mangrovicoccus algicola]
MPAPEQAFAARGFITAGLIMLAVLVGGLGGWAVFTTIAGAIVASGQIEVDRNRQVVQHPDGGVVQDIRVDEGDAVTADQVLVRLDGTLLQSQLNIVENQYFEILARRGRLEAEENGLAEISYDPDLLAVAAENPEIAELIDGQQRLFEARNASQAQEAEQLGKRRAQIANQIEGITAQQEALGTQLSLIRDELSDQTDLLNKGLAQRTRVLALQREEASLAGQLGELVASEAESEGRITEIDIEILKLDTSRREEATTTLRDLRYRELELFEQRQSLREQLSRLDIRAPVSGIVYGLTVYAERSVIRAADPVLYIVPQDRPLVIATKIETIHVDEVYPGQEVMVRFPAFSSRTTPELEGHITVVSADAFQDEQSGASFYRAEVVLEEGEAERLPGHVALLPGMPVEAYMRTTDRSPLAYLVKPFTDYFTRAFRES